MQMPEPGTNTRNWIKVGVSCGLLVAVFWLIPLEGVAESLRAADWKLVALSVAVMFLAHYVKSIQMHLLTRHLDISLTPSRIFVINLITKFYGLFLPGIIAGGAIRWYHLAREDQKPAQAFAAILLNRVLETSMILCLGFVFWLLDSSASTSTSGETFALVVGLSLVVYLVTFSRRAHAILLRCTDFGIVPAWVRIKARKVLSALGRYEDLSRWDHMTVIAMVIGNHLLGLMSLFILAVAIQIDIGLAALGWIRSIVTIVTLIPVTVAGLGVREATFVALLSPYGVAMSSALTLSLLVFARSLVFAFAGGLLEARRLVVGQKEYAK